MGHIIVELALVSDAVVEVEDYSLPLLHPFTIVSLVTQSRGKFVHSLSVLVTISERPGIGAIGFGQNPCINNIVPCPWNWFLKLKYPLYT